MKTNINDSLGKLRCWKDETCIDCGRKPSESRLNIEGVIHHKSPLRCIDRKSCEKLKRKKASRAPEARRSETRKTKTNEH